MKAAVSSGDLKSILLSKRANLYYLEYCRVLCNGGRVEFVTDEGKRSLYWNIPIANTTTVLLGNGTSITQAAMRELAKAGVLVGFCGGGARRCSVPMKWMSKSLGSHLKASTGPQSICSSGCVFGLTMRCGCKQPKRCKPCVWRAYDSTGVTPGHCARQGF